MIEFLKTLRVDLMIACVAVLFSAPVIAAIDLRDYDNDLMRDLEKTVKYFEPDITAKNADAAKEDAQVLLDGFKYTESYFKKKDAADAVEISRKGVKLISDVIASVDGNDFDAAAAAARGAPDLCKSCHDIYKPRLAR
ncbi:hypothetical protein OGR47_15940 [Methylocystis sp. MJC1]|jgi:hypothetical protein|uniref:hypothetical protein n=1 Tax=Methylocystis sp. MJC1 TaxID=2654282 RepID=UPI0013EC14C2|nr:hypothetical protein [Methylocystis sp. MJC1]KAF2989135.1 hypothetical protein MJC1_03798 [Methylocystis sp. MJC1]MBU6528449.1 hypothetical protein [Methylocystis sp. MJC1]UZX11349.1 hypothetical protein OGR47_15940 [Methylocystis sp. MJC1]